MQVPSLHILWVPGHLQTPVSQTFPAPQGGLVPHWQVPAAEQVSESVPQLPGLQH